MDVEEGDEQHFGKLLNDHRSLFGADFEKQHLGQIQIKGGWGAVCSFTKKVLSAI